MKNVSLVVRYECPEGQEREVDVTNRVHVTVSGCAGGGDGYCYASADAEVYFDCEGCGKTHSFDLT